ncbi:MAG: hypothetical protein LBH20_06360 [Treponema sp.]|jgi:uncharacterized protein YxeA|nr:hypothetical protein [Treponema sp.]
MKKIIFCIIALLLSSCKANIGKMHNTITEMVNNIIKYNYDINYFFHESVGKRDDIALIVMMMEN